MLANTGFNPHRPASWEAEAGSGAQPVLIAGNAVTCDSAHPASEQGLPLVNLFLRDTSIAGSLVILVAPKLAY